MTKAKPLFVSTFLALAAVLTYGAAAQRAASGLPKVAKVTANDPVTLTENGDSWVLDNGIVKATISKQDAAPPATSGRGMNMRRKAGDMTSLIYHGIEILNPCLLYTSRCV